MQSWGCASSTGLRRDGELEEGSRKRALRSDGNDATPPEDPSSLGRSPQRGGGAGRPRTSKEAHEGASFRVPSPPDFKPENDEPAPPTAVKFGISLPPLAARSVAQGTARVGGSPGLWQPLARHRADEGRIDRELRAVPQVEAVAHDFDAPCVVDRHVEVHGRQGDVAPDTRAGLLANPGYSACKASTVRCHHSPMTGCLRHARRAEAQSKPAASSKSGTYTSELVPAMRGSGGGTASTYWTTVCGRAGSGAGTACDAGEGGSGPNARGLTGCAKGQQEQTQRSTCEARLTSHSMGAEQRRHGGGGPGVWTYATGSTFWQRMQSHCGVHEAMPTSLRWGRGAQCMLASGSSTKPSAGPARRRQQTARKLCGSAGSAASAAEKVLVAQSRTVVWAVWWFGGAAGQRSMPSASHLVRRPGPGRGEGGLWQHGSSGSCRAIARIEPSKTGV